MDILLSWSLSYLPLGGKSVIKIDDRIMIFKTKASEVFFECENFDDLELPGFRVENDQSIFTLIARKALPIGWCEGWGNKFNKIKSTNEDLIIFGLYPSTNLPPDKSGMSLIFHSIKNSSGDCLGHFNSACDESQDFNIDWLAGNQWSTIN